MRVALVHDYLNQYGGGERVLEVLMEMFPEAPIYTLLHDPAKTLNRFSDRIKKTSFLDFPLARRHHRWFIPLMPLAAQNLNLGDRYDLVISDSAGYAKGVNLNSKPVIHISYIHTPLRYAWETDNYFESKIFTGFFKPIFNYLKKWDFKAAQKPDILIANSHFIAEKIKKCYNREAKVIYPPVDISKFFYDPKSSILNSESSSYLAVGRLLHYKRFDLIIDAFAELKLPLKIVGAGPEKNNLERRIQNLKAKNIELISFVNDSALRKLYNDAKALIFPQVEDFGLVAAEAQSCGLPVIAYGAGGAAEIVEDGETGLFFAKQTAESLAAAVEKFEKTDFNRKKISEIAKRFSKENFKKEFSKIIDSLT